jgi:hypothetical protein
MNGKSLIAAGVLFAVGVAAAGAFVGYGFLEGRKSVRTVSVKGLAEREVAADLALWTLRFVETGDDLSAVQTALGKDAQAVRAFLADHDVPADAVEVQALDVTDLFAQPYRSGPVEARFIVSQTLLVRSTDVERIFQASQQIEDLIARGVILSSDGGPRYSGPVYLFTGLNAVKPAMIAEATANAREAAEQFASDSGSRLDGIQRASQGLFQILPRDPAPGIMEEQQIAKRLRVVSTVDYRLAD